MNQHQAPRGCVATLGHPANEILVVKGRDGWRYVDTGLPVSNESFRGGWDTYVPEQPDDADAIETLARALAGADGDGCFERLDAAKVNGETDDANSDHEDADYWRRLARAARAAQRTDALTRRATRAAAILDAWIVESAGERMVPVSAVRDARDALGPIEKDS